MSRPSLVLLLAASALTGCPNSNPGPPFDAGGMGLDAPSTSGECLGTATPCAARNAASCEAGGGCELSFCTGDGTCDGLTESACAANAACTWDTTTGPADTPCIGAPPSCGTLTSSTCETVPGCARPGGTDGGVVMRPDGGGVVPPGCNEAGGGIECDGDWTGRCTPACAATECCVPRAGRFGCVPASPDGTCPAADIFVDSARIDGHYAVEWQYFPADDCALVEGCVDGPGWRRLLRFDTWTPNTGGADLHLGATPAAGTESELYTWSSCHGHHHFDTYAQYELLSSGGEVAATGHKQAFCLLDYYRYPGTDGTGGFYNCSFQGIQMGWQDVYGRNLDCQWVDVTDVEPGDYSLHISLNVEHLLNEEDYGNNEATIAITIPPEATDITVPCTAGETGATRDCGWTMDGTRPCTAGAMVDLTCSAACGAGSCTGDTIVRACDASAGVACTGPAVLGSNDDSGCAMRDLCSSLEITCPASGMIEVFTGAYTPGMAATCNLP